jgi:hypothetical protein
MNTSEFLKLKLYPLFTSMSNKHNIPHRILDLYDQLIDSVPEIERKGKNNPYTSCNGHMFSMVAKEGYVGIRLPKYEKESFESRYQTGPAISYGAVMREYVVIPDDLLEDTAKLREYLLISYEYIQTLPPKSSKKK